MSITHQLFLHFRSAVTARAPAYVLLSKAELPSSPHWHEACLKETGYTLNANPPSRLWGEYMNHGLLHTIKPRLLGARLSSFN